METQSTKSKQTPGEAREYLVYKSDQIDAARKAWVRFCDERGLRCDTPNKHSYEENGVVFLMNTRGVLAKYRVTETGRIRRIFPK